MSDTLAFIDQMSGATYDSLSTTNFKLAIVDPDNSQLTSNNLASLEASGKVILSYLSIGAAETYRSYWESSWNEDLPDFVIGQDAVWGCHYVKFWDPAWQEIVIDRAVSLAEAGYDGVMLDLVDVYDLASVSEAAGGNGAARQLMMDFVAAIEAATTAIDPNFKIVQNNALDLLVVDPDNPLSASNTGYISHIDGVLCESTFYNSAGEEPVWSSYNIAYLKHAVDAGKTVLSMDYVADAENQEQYISKSISAGFVPYVTEQSLGNVVNPINYTIMDLLPSSAMDALLTDDTDPSSNSGDGTIHVTGTWFGTDANEHVVGSDGSDRIDGGAGDDVITGGKGNDFIKGGAGEDTVVFSGNRDGYTIVAESDGTFSITNRITGETDTVDFDVENAQFDDGTVTICFMPGTMVRTPSGEVAVETLQAGDPVLTREGTTQPVRWIGRQTVSTQFGDPLRVLPIRIKAGALGENVPSRDLLISPDHAILIDGALIHAGALVNGASIVRECDVPEVFTYYHVELDDHSLVLAENTPAETFVDNVERQNFDNWAEYQALYPKGKTITELPYPRAKAHRQVPVSLRVQLMARAQAIGAPVDKAVA